MKDLSNYRKSYERSSLDESTLPQTPMLLFGRWFAEMEASGLADEVNAMTIATVEDDGCPRSRVVLLKRFSTDGFTFYTNYNSAKGKAIAKNPKICLSFFWAAMERQVIIRGTAEKVPAADSEEYFH
ncbi:MAG: pyridoxal 5'-phosphate synthase, partial [Flavobacterium sp.]